ncbi:MAG: putative porin [Candidatus Omnitrophica bacterium]|nr:putative porin [Candidatus Omnitrophota bacterium]
MMKRLDELSGQIHELQALVKNQNEVIESQASEIESLKKAREGQPVVSIPAPAGEGKKPVEVPSWLEGLAYDGSFRLRYEAFDQSPNRADRNRFRGALNFGLKKDLGKDFLVGFRLGTGEPNTTNGSEGLNVDPTSGNQTFTNKFNFKNIWIQEMYARYMPSYLEGLGPIRKAEFGGGKFPNPLKDYSTSIVWDHDVRPEGAYEKIEVGVLKDAGALEDLSFTVLLSQFILGEVGTLHGDQEMYGYTGALDADVNVGLEKPMHYRVAANVYDFVDIEDNVFIGATSLARTNTSNAAGTLAQDDWNILQLYQEVSFKDSPIIGKPVKLWFDVAGNAEGSHVDGTVNSNERKAWSFGGKLNKLDKKGSWEAGYQYFRIEPNAVVAAFNESDLGLGFTDKVGSKIWSGYGLTDNLALNFTMWFVDDLTQNAGNDNVDRYQTDLTWKW